MTEERFKDMEIRLRKVEDLLIRLDAIIDLMHKLTNRVEHLEDHDKEAMSFIHESCTLKDREITKSKEDAIKISVEHANNNHKQTWGVIAFVISSIIGITIYFNAQDSKRALDIQKHETNIENISKVLEKIDTKLDKVYAHVQNDEQREANSNRR